MVLKTCMNLVLRQTVTSYPIRKETLLPLTFMLTRQSSTVSPIFTEYHRERKKDWDKTEKKEATKDDKDLKATSKPSKMNALMYKMPEFVPTTYWGHRDSVREAMERVDLIKRRNNLKIPEFYVGSVLAVTVTDEGSPTKLTRFVGICISRGEPGLRHRFILRNVIDGQGVEIMYEMYNPLIRDIQVLKLERWVDEELYYLRDALPEFSTIPFDFKAVPRIANEAIPINKTLVKMKPRPWTQRWERGGFKGIDEETIVSQLSPKMRMQRLEPTRNNVWEKYDLALQFRNSVTREETETVYRDMSGQYDNETDTVVIREDKAPAISRKKNRRVAKN